MKRAFLIIISLMFSALADHPNEGALTLDDLVAEALANNHEIKDCENKLKSFESFTQSKKGVFFPEVSVEGEPLEIKLYNYEVSGSTLYGNAEWNLYRGGKDQANLEKAKIGSEFSHEQLEQSKVRVRRDVT